MYTALLDTCVLWPSLQRDFLLSLAVEGLYRPVWSSAVLDELHIAEENKQIKHGHSPEGARRRADHLIDQMETGFIDAHISEWERFDGTFGLPDPDDEHLLAAAVVGHAEAVVTNNLKDLPSALVPEPIQVLSARDFAFNTVAVSPSRARAAITQISRRFGRSGPPRSESDIRTTLRDRYGMHDAVDLLEL